MHLKTTMALAVGLLFAQGANAETYRWDNVAMGSGGFVTGVVPSKSEHGVVYARTDVGGSYRWDGRSERWIPLTDWISESDTGLMGVESIAVDPRNAGTVYMLAGTSYFSNGKTVIMRSTDYGQHFDMIDVTAQFKAHGNGMGRQSGERLQVDPGSSNVLYVGTRANGLFKSVDSGATWTRLNGLNVNETPNGNGISFVLPDPTSVSGGTAKRIFVGVSRFGSVGPNLYMSKDGGVTFAPVAGAPAGLMPQRATMTSKGRLYLTYANGAGPHGADGEPMDRGQIWEYNTVGGAWTNITPAGMNFNAFGGISVDPANPKHLIASTINMYWLPQKGRSSNGDHIFTSYDAGRSWVDLNEERGLTIDGNGADWGRDTHIHWAGDVQFDPFDPKTAWVISGAGLYKTTDLDAPVSTWKFDVHGMEETAAFDAESIPGGPLVSVLGDVDGFIHTDPAQYGPRHSPAIGTTTGLAVAPQATHVMARVGASDIYISTSTGASWEKAPVMNGKYGKLALSADGAVLLHSPEGSTTTYRSTDLGASWTPVAGLSVKDAFPVADKVNPAKFYVYDRNAGKLLVSTDGGVSFSAKAGLPTGGNSQVRATPGIEGDLWACLDSKGLSHSTDSGATFTKVAGINSCGAVGLGKEAPGASYPTLYMWGAVNDVRGLLRSTDKGAHWDRVNDDAHQYGGPMMGWVNGDMNTYGTVYMSTNGRGIAYGKIDPSGDVQVVPQVAVKPTPTAVCKYEVTSTWWGGGIGNVSITNQGTETLHGWQVSWTYSDGSYVSGNAWNGFVTGSAPTFTGSDGGGWNKDIAPGGTASFGFVVAGQDAMNANIPKVTGDICIGSEPTNGSDVPGGGDGAPTGPSVLGVPPSLKVQEGLTASFLLPSATVAAGRTATWSISGLDAALFKIDPATGALSFRQAPDTAHPADADARNDYDLIVQVSDGQGSTQEAPLRVLVRPWNDGGAAGLPVPLVAREVGKPAGTTGQPGLRVLDWAGFKAAMSYTFDDSQPSQIDHYPALKAQRVRSTYYVMPGANWYPNFDATWKDAVAQGSEIGNHTTHHCRAVELSDNDPNTCPQGLGSAGAEFDDTNDYIRTKIGQSAVWTTAYPFGDMDYKPAAASRFMVARGVWPGVVAPGTGSDLMNLPVVSVPGEATENGHPVSSFNAAVDNALGQGKWMIYLFHTVLPAPTQNWGGGEDIGVITGNMTYAKSFGTMWIDSVVNIGAYWRGQQLLQAATPTTSGGVTTWTWTLPPNFPSGRKLRVKVDGGTLSQNGTPLNWDSHGYYEVSLDAQSLSWTQ